MNVGLCFVVRRLERIALVWNTGATGDVSVMPHAWLIGIPIARSNPPTTRGTADPPHTTDRNADRSRPLSSGRTPIEIVGTPAAISAPLRSGWQWRAERSGPGIANEAPHATPAGETRVGVEHRHHGGMRSCSLAAKPSASRIDMVCNHEERCSTRRLWDCRWSRSCNTSMQQFSSSTCHSTGWAAASSSS